MGKKKIRPEEVTDTPEAIAAEEQPTAGAAASGAPEDIAEPVPEPERVTDGTADADDMASETDEGDEEALEARLEQAEMHAAELLESLQRERASFQNYKRRVEAERAGQWQAATGAVLLKMIPVLDDFHRAMDAVPEADRDQWYEGVLMIQRKFERVLADQGVTEIEALGKSFDPNFHEAVGVDNDADAEPETVTIVLQRGYMQGDKVLRPAMVRVSG